MPGILSRLRNAGENFIGRQLGGEALSFTAAIPGRAGPLWQVTLEALSEPQASGERLRVRAHFRLSLRRALPAPDDAPSSRPALPARVGRWIERRLESPLVQAVATPLLDRDVSTWVELRASDADLDEGSHALVPEQLTRLGLEVQPDRPLQTWAGAVAAPTPGFAMLTLLQLDKDKLPPRLRRIFGDRPFHVAGAVVNVIEEAAPEQ